MFPHCNQYRVLHDCIHVRACAQAADPTDQDSNRLGYFRPHKHGIVYNRCIAREMSRHIAFLERKTHHNHDDASLQAGSWHTGMHGAHAKMIQPGSILKCKRSSIVSSWIAVSFIKIKDSMSQTLRCRTGALSCKLHPSEAATVHSTISAQGRAAGLPCKPCKKVLLFQLRDRVLYFIPKLDSR